MAGSWCVAWSSNRCQNSSESNAPDNCGTVRWQKNSKLRRSSSYSNMVVLTVKLRIREEQGSMPDVSELAELGAVPSRLEEYPSHVRPVLLHRWHSGFSLPHLMRRILGFKSAVPDFLRYDDRSFAYLQVLHPPAVLWWNARTRFWWRGCPELCIFV